MERFFAKNVPPKVRKVKYVDNRQSSEMIVAKILEIIIAFCLPQAVKLRQLENNSNYSASSYLQGKTF